MTLTFSLWAPHEARPGLQQTGRWTPASSSWGHMQIHMALLRGDNYYHSKLFAWDDYHNQNAQATVRGTLWGWNPSGTPAAHDCSTYPTSPQFTLLPLDTNNFSNIFCSGFSTLGTGELLIAGGEQGAPRIGQRTSYLFRPNATLPFQWSQQGSMSFERWYPTNTTLPDGKVLTFAGERFWHLELFGGQDQNAATHDDINRLGLIPAGEWLSTIPRPSGSAEWPAPREGHSAVWHLGVGDMIMFGGRTAANPDTIRDDIWQLHVNELPNDYQYVWSRITPLEAEPKPDPRMRHSAVVLKDGRMIVFGGLDENTEPRSDIWQLSRDEQTLQWHWASITPIGTGPGARYGHTAISDTVNNRMLVFGGLTTSGVLANNDVYALTFNPPSWTLIPSATSKPNAREGHSLVFDPLARAGGAPSYQRRAVLFGGKTSINGSPQNDVWVLWIKSSGDSVRWEPVSPGSGPSGRTRHAATWDGVLANPAQTYSLDRMIVLGGNTGTSPTPETWALKWNSANYTWSWTQLASQPSALAGQTAAFNPDEILFALDPELYTPSTSQWTSQGAPLRQPVYPYMFVVPSGNVFYAGPTDYTFLFRRTAPSPSWQVFPSTASPFLGASAVAYRPGGIMKCGLYIFGQTAGGNTAFITINANDSPTAWVSSVNQMKPRIFHNLTMLPTGQVLVTGGLSNGRSDEGEGTNASVKEPELWNPPQAKWTGLGTLAPDPARRGYHSTAILLPDGRVLTAGGETPSTNPDWNKATIFCPPYLFNSDGSLAVRPIIDAAPDIIDYHQEFSICTVDPSIIQSVCLMRPGAVTHAFDMGQSYVPLDVSVDVSLCRLRVTSPPDSNSAPPGDYMLFIVNQDSVPSMAKWVRLRNNASIAGPNCQCADGCPVVDTRTASGWQEENTILGRSLSGALTLDAYRLKATPQVVDGRYQLRLRENEQEFTTLDQVRLVAVDHAPGVRAWPLGDRVVLGTREAPYRVTTSNGTDVTHLVDGSGTAFFVGEPGETLLVELRPPTSGQAPGTEQHSPDELDPFEIDPGGKGGGGEGMVAAGTEGMQRTVDAAVLNTTGILVQGRDSTGIWRTVRRYYPRERFDPLLVDTLDQGPLRLVFVDRHGLRFVGRVIPSGLATPVSLDLLAANHSRWGEVRAAVLGAGGTTTAIAPGDTLGLQFAASPVPAGQVRDLFLLTRGVYSSVQPQSQEVAPTALPARFALLQNRPNPFAHITRIHFELPQAERVRLEVFDLQGRLVTRLVDRRFEPGRWSAEWDRRDSGGNRVGPGIYLYRIKTGSYCAERKMVLLP